ncbi:hypothetical protein [Sphingobium sp. B2]|uniref:hypothetical protein n=1 Tax=Sphingobium sp. B2 TaxID=2583228 RepID=UPI00119EE457|nr:hypothetical protein [Sphingobium sp. B2]
MSKATITYDPFVVRQWTLPTEAYSIAHLFREGLLGEAYPEERGILRIDLEPDVPVVLPVDWVDRLLKIAIDRGAQDFTERRLFDYIAHEIGRAKA